MFAADFYRCLILVKSNHLPKNKPNLGEEQPFKNNF